MEEDWGIDAHISQIDSFGTKVDQQGENFFFRSGKDSQILKIWWTILNIGGANNLCSITSIDDSEIYPVKQYRPSYILYKSQFIVY